ncbi:MAG: hypothetical protein CL534_15385 [Ahrensia sp.]|nr:hypothetical protein [Ahrensia sp.]
MNDDVNERLNRAIARNRAALLRILAFLFMKAGLDEGGAEMLPRPVWRSIIDVLRPAESAVRRLIVIAARDIVVTLRQRAARPSRRIAPHKGRRAAAASLKPGREAGKARPEDRENKTVITSVVFPRRPAPEPAMPKTGVYWQGRFVRPGETPWAPKSEPARPLAEPSFALADASLRFSLEPVRRRPAAAPRIHSLCGPSLPLPAPEPEPEPTCEIPARSVCRRLIALKSALDDLPGHALRLARLGARRNFLARHGDIADAVRPAPIRRGRPPGWRRKMLHPVDDILKECHALAWEVRRPYASPP